MKKSNKLRMIRFVRFLAILTLFPISDCKSTSNAEGLIEKDSKKFYLKKNGILNEDIFNEIFPASTNEEFSHGWYCGQLRNASGGRGTGTLIAIKKTKNSGTLIGIGITALHVFLEPYLGSEGLREYKHTSGWAFYQNSTFGEGKFNFFAKVVVDKVLFDPVLGRDICLFKGKYILNGGYAPDQIAQLLPIIKEEMPKISSSLVPSKKSRRAFFYHYPLGDKVQRVNTGKFSSKKGIHKISSLPGSSGASLFYDSSKDEVGYIAGIHIGRFNGLLMGLVYQGAFEQEIPIVSDNKFDSINQEDIKAIKRNGVDLYSMATDLYALLVPSIYIESAFSEKSVEEE